MDHLVPSDNEWEIGIRSHDWLYVLIYIDEVHASTIGGREGSGALMFSDLILNGRNHVLSLKCSDGAAGNGGGGAVYTLRKNGVVVLERTVHEDTPDCSRIGLKIDPNGTVSLQ